MVNDARRALLPIFLDGQVAQHGRASVLSVHEADPDTCGSMMWIFCKGVTMSQLQVHPAEEFERVAGRLVGAAAKSLIDSHETERARALHAPFESELVSQAGREHSVG